MDRTGVMLAEYLPVPETDDAPTLPVQAVVAYPFVLGAELLGAALAAHDRVEVAGVATTMGTARDLVARHRPDVLVCSDLFPDFDAGEVVEAAGRLSPSSRVVVVGTSESHRDARGVLDAGCAGYVTRSSSLATVLHTVLHAASGRGMVEPSVVVRAVDRRRSTGSEAARLTRRQREILELMARGSSNAEIAEELFISPATVRNHVHQILARLSCRSRVEAVSVAVRAGLVDYG